MDEVAIAAGHKLASVVGLPQHLQERVLALVNAQDERLLGLLASVDLDNMYVRLHQGGYLLDERLRHRHFFFLFYFCFFFFFLSFFFCSFAMFPHDWFTL